VLGSFGSFFKGFAGIMVSFGTLVISGFCLITGTGLTTGGGDGDFLIGSGEGDRGLGGVGLREIGCLGFVKVGCFTICLTGGSSTK